MSSYITNLNDNSKELLKVANRIANVRLTIDGFWKNLDMKIFASKSEIENCRCELQDCLEKLADFTIPIFDLRDKMELYYYTAYDNKNLASTIWLEHYKSLHKPFDVQKNFTFFLLEKLEQYEKGYSRNGELKLLKTVLC